MSDSSLLDHGLEWREIPGFDSRYVAHPSGMVASVARQKILKPTRLHKGIGYQVVSLPKPDGSGFLNHYLHRLILETFLGPCPEGWVAHFINGDMTDVRLVNLEWRPIRGTQAHVHPVPVSNGVMEQAPAQSSASTTDHK